MTRLSDQFANDKQQLFNDYLRLTHEQRDSRLAALIRDYELRIAAMLAR